MSASECINIMDTRTYGGNMEIKYDIRKAFDTLEWSFILQVLNAFGFSDMFVQWIHSIMLSARLSIN